MRLLHRTVNGPAIVLLLLLCQFALRTHQIEIQDPYVDEGFHISRAQVVWDFEQHPARFSYGKLLVYFWIGLFEAGNDETTLLAVARLSLAVVSVVTGAGIYLLGRLLANHATGVVALGLYAVLPMAVFYERLAFADPLASALTVLAVWRCWVYVRRPTWAQAVLCGALLALATLAKMTIGGLVLLPAGMALIHAGRSRGKSHIAAWMHWLRRYGPGLVTMGVTFCLFWAPSLIPAYLARNSDNPFVIVTKRNITRRPEDPANAAEYLQRILPLLEDFLHNGLLIAVCVATLIGLIFALRERRLKRGLYTLLLWFGCTTVLLLLVARLATTRYFIPAMAPLVLLLALVGVALWQRGPLRIVLRPALAIALLAWMLGWAMPMVVTTLHAPRALPFRGSTWTEFHAGYLIADDAVRAAAASLNGQQPRIAYATWNQCHMAFYYVETDLQCLSQGTPVGDLRRAVDELEAGEELYLFFADYAPFYERLNDIEWEIISTHDREQITRPVSVIRIWREADAAADPALRRITDGRQPQDTRTDAP